MTSLVGSGTPQVYRNPHNIEWEGRRRLWIFSNILGGKALVPFFYGATLGRFQWTNLNIRDERLRRKSRSVAGNKSGTLVLLLTRDEWQREISSDQITFGSDIGWWKWPSEDLHASVISRQSWRVLKPCCSFIKKSQENKGNGNAENVKKKWFHSA